MPRYFFNLRVNGEHMADDEGTELEDEIAARAHAEDGAIDILAELLRARKPFNEEQIEVSDEAGRVLFTLRLREIAEEALARK